LNRELLDYSKLLEIYDNKKLQEDLEWEESGYEITPEFREYLNRKINRTNSELYMNTLALAGVIPVGEALDIHKKFKELNEKDDAVNAAYAGQAQKLIIELNKGELEDDKRRGWDAEVKRLKNIINEQNDKLKVIDQNAIAGTAGWTAVEINKRVEKDKTTTETMKELGEQIKKLDDERKEAIKSAPWDGNTKGPILEKQMDDIKAKQIELQNLKNKFYNDTNKTKSFDEYEEELKEFKEKEKEFTETSRMYRLSMLLHREKSEEGKIASAEELAEHRNAPTQVIKGGLSEAGRVITRQAKNEESARELAEREAEIRSREDLTNEEKEKRIRELPRKDIIRSLIQGETQNELNVFRQAYPEEKNKKMWENAMERADAEYLKGSKDMVTALKDQSKVILGKYKDALDEKNKQINEIFEGIKQLEAGQKKLAKLANDPNEAWRYEEVQNSLKVLNDKKTDALKQREVLYNDWKNFQIEHRSVFKPDRTKELFRRESETKEGEYLRDVRSDLEENMYGGRFSRVAEPVSKAVQKVTEGVYKHGGKALLAAAVLAPLAMPVVGPVIALEVGLGAAGVYGAKTGLRKGAEWEEHMAPGSKIHKVTEWVQSNTPWSSGFDAVARDVYHASRFAPHFTGRGSGAPPTTYAKAWESQMQGTAYITKGFRVNEFGEVEPFKEKLSLPYEGLPWYIHIAKQPFESVGATLSSRVRKNALWWMNHGGAKDFARFVKQSPTVIPEIEEGIQYQYAKLFGSVEYLTHPKQAWEMTEYKAVALSMPYQEQAKNIILIRDYGYNPMADKIKEIRNKKNEDLRYFLTKNLMDKVSDSAVAGLRKKRKYRIAGEIT
jgi:hypothetical protein